MDVRVCVHRGREVHVDSEGVYLARNVVRRFVRVVGKPCRSYRHVAGSLGGVAFDVPYPAAFLVGRHEKRNLEPAFLRPRLHFVHRFRHVVGVVGVPAEDFDASKPALGNPPVQERARLLSRPSEHQNLRQKFVVAHLGHEEVGEFSVRVVAPEVRVVWNLRWKGSQCQHRKDYERY